MRINIILILSLILVTATASSQGKYAGTKKSLIGKTFTDSRKLTALKGWQFREGSVITPVDDPEMMTMDVFQKGTTCIVIAGYKEDTAMTEFTIADVIEVKNVLKGWQIRAAFCRRDQMENVEIVAHVKSSTTQEFLKPAKQAWRFNRDKKRFEGQSVKAIDCINEGLD
jgi:hypothetical protein